MGLLDQPPFSLPVGEKHPALLMELNEEFAFHYSHSPLFRRICEGSGWTPEKPAARLEDLPFVPVQYFKEAGRELVSVADDKVHRFLQSSATSGRPSIVAVDKKTAKRQVSALTSVLGDFIGKERRPFLVCDLPSDEDTNAPDLPARLAALQGFLSFATERVYVLTKGGQEQLVPDLDLLAKNIDRLVAKGRAVVVCGFTFLLHTALLKPLKDAGLAFRLPPGSSIIHIGGWKRLERHMVDRSVLISTATEVLGIEPERVVDVYGFTEQMGTVYPECPHRRKHVPVFAEVLVRNPTTFEPLPDGEVGDGQFLSLVPRSYPGFSVLTDDLIRITGRDDCSCGRLGTTFEALGRSDKAEIRGCGDVQAEKVIGPSAPAANPAGSGETGPVPASSGGAATPAGDPPATVLFDGSRCTFQGWDVDAAKLEILDDWDGLGRRLRGAQQALLDLPVDDIIGVIQEASEVWAQPDGPFARYRQQGLGFIVNWVRSGQLQMMVDFSLRGSRGALDGFQALDGDVRRMRALPRGIVVHWLAGNVPSLGFISLLLSMVTKNANVLKLASDLSPLVPRMLQTVSEATYRSAGGRLVEGRRIAAAVAAVYFPSESQHGAILSTKADVRIAWGGTEAVKAVMALPRKHGAEDIVFGPKLSLVAVGREALPAENKAKRVARNVAVDCSIFDQEACASAHTVFVEKGAPVAPERFAEILAEQMALIAVQIPHGSVDAGVADRVKSARMRHFLDGRVLTPTGLEWTVLYRDTPELEEPVYGRTVFVRAVDDLDQIVPQLGRHNQVVGLALPTVRRAVLAEKLARAGVDRVTPVGRMAEFTSPWDGVFPIDRLVRWTSLA